MISIKNIKLFAISALTFALYVQAISVSQIGDIRIERSNDKWLCDMIECPLNSYRCYVSKSNEENPSILKRVNICFAQDNNILAHKISSLTTDPKNQIRLYINSDRSGATVTTSNNSENNFDEEAFNEYLDNEMKKLNSNLANLRENIESNIQKEMNKLQNSLGDVEYRLQHMFDGHLTR